MENNENLKVSIIVPVYNMEKYLGECLDSLINQTYSNIEIICVNDGSQDKSLTILEDYQKKDNRIIIINQKNQGVSVARNVGLDNATGYYIYFMDSDDFLNDVFIETSVDIAQKEQSEVIIVGTNVDCKKSCSIDNYYTGAPWEFFIKHSILKNNKDIRFPEGFQHCEDNIFTHKLLCLVNTISMNPHAYYNYREISTSSSHTIHKKINYYYDIIIICSKILDLFYKKYPDISKNKISLMITEMFIIQYWACNFSMEQKREIFRIFNYFKNEYKLAYFYSYTGFLTNFMIQRFINCRKWWHFEGFLMLIKIYKHIKRNKFIGRRKVN